MFVDSVGIVARLLWLDSARQTAVGECVRRVGGACPRQYPSGWGCVTKPRAGSFFVIGRRVVLSENTAYSIVPQLDSGAYVC